VATGNNIDVSQENSRRVCRIHLDRGVEDPTQGLTFQIPNLHNWVKAHRMEVTWAALTIIQTWLNADHPEGYESYEDRFRPLEGTRMKQSYIEWSRVMGGILKFMGQDGFLEHSNLDDTTEQDELADFLEAWATQAPQPEPVKNLRVELQKPASLMQEALPSELAYLRSDILAERFPPWLKAHRNRVAGGYKLIQAKETRPRTWQVIKTRR
jgi:hypothetical protein